MRSSPRCRRTRSYCRPLRSGQKARPGKACSRTIRGVAHHGTQVAGYYSPKARCGGAASRIQAAFRSRKTSGSRKRKTTTSSGRSVKKPKRLITTI